MKLRYLVVAPPYNPDSGGSIFLHELVHALNSLGASAALWPIAPREALTRRSIVVFPEVVLGNPLRARHVVRWLLFVRACKIRSSSTRSSSARTR